jgi:dihydrodipicolinate reductase
LAFAVDFSRPETAVEEMAIRHYVDDVELVIGAFGEPLKDFNKLAKGGRDI